MISNRISLSLRVSHPKIENPDALPDAGVREAIELPTVGERQVIHI
jgi:hypothetical protein